MNTDLTTKTDQFIDEYIEWLMGRIAASQQGGQEVSVLARFLDEALAERVRRTTAA